MTKEELTTEALQKALDWATTTKELVATEVPKLCNEIITFGYITHGSWVVLSALLIITFLIIGRKLQPWVWKNTVNEYDGPGQRACYVIFARIVAPLLLLLPLTINLYYLCLVLFAPRLYLLHELSALL